jgi:hypothetical protein
VLSNDAGIRGKFGINAHPHGFVLALGAGEDDMVPWCERFEFDASTAFGTGDSKRKREPQCPTRPEFPGPLHGPLICSRLRGGATVDSVGHRGESERSALDVLEDEDKSVGMAFPDGVCC